MKSNRPEGIRKADLDLPPAKEADLARWAVDLVCRACCEYFRGTGGESGCGGYSAVLSGLRSGMIDRRRLERITSREPAGPRRVVVLEKNLCSVCGYRPDGCDYQSSAPPVDASPCGGYRLLQMLIDTGAFSADELEEFLG